MNNEVKLILGTMNFGPQIDVEGGKEMLQRFLRSGNTEVDTAYVYNDGRTDEILGIIFKEINRHNYKIATKIHPRITGKLDAESINLQLNESLAKLECSTVDLLYFHFPDSLTPIEEALETCNYLFNKGIIKELGLSNFPAWMVVDIWHKCNQRGWLKPSVYQGMYNSVCRNVEDELIPAIRKLGMRFYAFNPLAGGMLTGKHINYDATPSEGRFSRLQSYRQRYWKKSYFNAVNHLVSSCQKENIPLAEAAYRWLAYHSFLNPFQDDGIIVGASSMAQFNQNIEAVSKGKLPESVIDAFLIAWNEAKTESPSYFQFFPK